MVWCVVGNVERKCRQCCCWYVVVVDDGRMDGSVVDRGRRFNGGVLCFASACLSQRNEPFARLFTSMKRHARQAGDSGWGSLERVGEAEERSALRAVVRAAEQRQIEGPEGGLEGGGAASQT